MDPHDMARYYNSGTLGSFSTKLIELFTYADLSNQATLRQAFPIHWEAYQLWFHKPEGWDRESTQNGN